MPEELCHVCCKSHYGSLALHSDPSPYNVDITAKFDLGITFYTQGLSFSGSQMCSVSRGNSGDSLQCGATSMSDGIFDKIFTRFTSILYSQKGAAHTNGSRKEVLSQSGSTSCRRHNRRNLQQQLKRYRHPNEVSHILHISKIDKNGTSKSQKIL